MPVTIKTADLKYKSSSTGNYVGINAVAERTTAEMQSAVNAAGVAQITAVNNAGTQRINAINTRAAEVEASLPKCDEMEAMVANPFLSTKPYVEGEYVIQNVDGVNKLYRFEEDHPAGAWTGTDVSEAKLADNQRVLEALVSRKFTPQQIQTIAAFGQARKFFNIGDIITIPWTDYTPETPLTYQYPFVVVHIGDVVDDHQVTHHDALYLMAMYATPQTIQFDAPEQIIATEETFQENTYYYIKNGDDWVEQTVTVGDPIPSGTTYYKHYRTGMAGRIRYGSNNYKESAYRQWLNSTGGKDAWWTAQHASDVAPAQATTVPGFLTGFTEDWLAIFKPVEVKCYRNTACDGGGWDTMYDRFFLPSVEQMYGSPQLSGEGDYWEYWKEETGLTSPSNGSSTNTNDARKIPSVASPTGSAVYVRLRSASRGNTYYTWYVVTAGYLNNYNAYYAYRALPACVIY